MAQRSRAHRLLLAVCSVFALLSLALVPLTLPLGWDEIVYASRYSPYAPATPFSAPRTRGVPFLIAPVATWSDSVVLLRVWLTLLSTTALYLGFRPWLRVLHRPSAVAVAAALYGGLWFTLFYASAAMPNHYTAMGAVGAVGLFLWPRQSAATRAGIAAGLALATLMRPNDGVALGVPLLAAALTVPGWRGRGRVLTVLGGVAAGALPWIVEAYVRFGGVRERLTEASEVQGDLRPLLSFVHHLTVMDGPLLCRPCGSDGIRPLAAEWWLLLPFLVAVGLWSVTGLRSVAGLRSNAGLGSVTGRGSVTGLWKRQPLNQNQNQNQNRRQRQSQNRHQHRHQHHRQSQNQHQHQHPAPAPIVLRGCLLAGVTALAVALPYLLLVPYAAPRFLLPAHALLTPAAALGVLALAGAARASRWPRLGVIVLGLALAGHLVVQLLLAHGNARIQAGARGDWARVADVLHAHGVGATAGTPCVLRGNTSVIPVAYASGCAPGGSAYSTDSPGSTNSPASTSSTGSADSRGPGAPHRPTALVLREADPPRWARSWPRHPVPGTYAPGWVIHVRP
ncbi:hypothetical protein AB0N81_26795 [Streptomyces sp. NPDC093510]|uniref:hypothetical protein n=1 Tax=Streptomyces sp. NPDC093510 TaxID=3155199 RepID=UPI0034396BFB